MRYIEHPDQDLNPQAFKKESGRLKRLYGKSDPPPPPDYAAAADQTAQGNLDMAQFATNANRVDQYTPYGSLEYNYTPQYDAEGNETGAGWEQRMNLTPEAQNALNQQLALNTKYGETANIGFDRARELFENPQLDTSGLPARAINVGQTAQDAILSRLNPQLQQQEEQLRTRMANQGITLGSDAYGREMTQQGQRANDLQMQAALQGIGLDQSNRSAALQEQAYLQDRPLNLINALRTGNQVSAPQFQQFAQQQTTAGPNVLGATGAQYQAQVDAVNAQNEGTENFLGGLMNLGTTMMGMPPGVGSSMFSDRRLKKNVKLVGKLDSGLNVYQYEYIWGGPTQIGVMAQEVEKVNPEAVIEVNGFKAVKYDRL